MDHAPASDGLGGNCAGRVAEVETLAFGPAALACKQGFRVTLPPCKGLLQRGDRAQLRRAAVCQIAFKREGPQHVDDDCKTLGLPGTL